MSIEQIYGVLLILAAVGITGYGAYRNPIIRDMIKVYSIIGGVLCGFIYGCYLIFA
jgi:uncharacterized membrane protein